jgi:hypothetical protein
MVCPQFGNNDICPGICRKQRYRQANEVIKIFGGLKGERFLVGDGNIK